MNVLLSEDCLIPANPNGRSNDIYNGWWRKVKFISSTNNRKWDRYAYWNFKEIKYLPTYFNKIEKKIYCGAWTRSPCLSSLTIVYPLGHRGSRNGVENIVFIHPWFLLFLRICCITRRITFPLYPTAFIARIVFFVFSAYGKICSDITKSLTFI